MSDARITPDWWRSFDEREDSPEFRKFVEAEFPSQQGKVIDPMSRRRFLKVMGASMALAGLAGCRWPEEEIVPFARRPEDTVPGVAKHFASTFEVGGIGYPVVVKSYDGRPVKVDGNRIHPMSQGASDATTQASVLGLYDPDRSRFPVRDGEASSWTAFEGFAEKLREKYASKRGKGLFVLSEAWTSPTAVDLRERFLEVYPEARWHEYEAASRDNELEGLRYLGAVPARIFPRIEDADLVVCLDDDLLGDHPMHLVNTKYFAAGRRGTDGRMKRLLAVESGVSLTGAAADHRYPLPRHLIVKTAALLASRILPGAKSGGGAGEPAESIADALAKELTAHRGKCLITAGPGLPEAVHSLVALMNRELHSTMDYIEAPEHPAYADSITAFCQEMDRGAVETLVILGGNPVFDAPAFGPAGTTFADLLEKVETTVHLSLYRDETSKACTWHLNRAHWLESWGDARAYNGMAGVVQPLIRPLHGGRSHLEVVALLSGEQAPRGHDLVRRAWMLIFRNPFEFEGIWQRTLHDGFAPMLPPYPLVDLPLESGRGPELVARILDVTEIPRWEIDFRPDPRIHDGRFANNGWLVETPHPITKLTWDNAALVSPKDAETLGVRDGDHLKISVVDGGPRAQVVRSITIPAFVQPGQAAGMVTLHAGHGRTDAGRVGNGAGTNVFPLLPLRGEIRVERAGGHTELACTHNHHAIDEVGRKAVQRRMHELIRSASLEEYKKHPEFAKHVVHHPPLLSLWKEKDYEGRRWGMMIDLSTCTGCSACVVACQSENNVPVVGKDEVLRGREMHWLRVDRYFGGDPEDPEIAFQPIPCMQCENAPCEQVCPVAATVHSAEGLNDMVYNRCVGTRYCSNNCPYKVRRFNWFKNHRDLTNVQKMVMNPEVTVRSRGVMEKCTYCVQRISAARIAAKNEGRPIADGEVVPACAQACPAEAIVFGDLSDPKSKVRRLAESDRAYGILDELNVKPRTRYLARLRNPME